MKNFLATVALLALIGPAQAQFKATPTVTTFEGGNFDCGVLQLAQHGVDSDPVSTINVSLIFKDNDELASMDVAHTHAFGVVSTRSDQDTDVTLAQTPGKLDVVWHGVWKKNHSVAMTGHIWHSDHWFYSEVQTQNGQVQMRMLAGCHVRDGE